MILSEIRHRNLVTLIGYCQEGGLQMLVFEYLPNGSVSNHLYGNDRLISKGKIFCYYFIHLYLLCFSGR